MSDLRPEGNIVKIGGEAHSLLFTLSVIDAVQYKYGENVWETLKRLAKSQEGLMALRFILKELLNDEAFRTKTGRTYTEEDVGNMVLASEIPGLERAIITAYGMSVPQAEDEEENDPDDSPQLLDVAQILVICVSKMGFSEEETFKMTPRKFFRLFEKFTETSGTSKTSAIDELP